MCCEQQHDIVVKLENLSGGGQGGWMVSQMCLFTNLYNSHLTSPYVYDIQHWCSQCVCEEALQPDSEEEQVSETSVKSSYAISA